ncbi:alpha/beta hydrolase [Streptomyces sp. NPDC089799]|uniref:alpha/beta hydrolase n=1 Tax=Streptomyces sp. NPDC089799 TaxID=3155066 RepID=UPI00341D27D2
MVSLPDLRDLRLGELTEAANGWAEAANRARSARDLVTSRMINALRDSQHGEAATGAYRQLGRLKDNFQYVHTECAMLQTALNGIVEELTGPQRRVLEALAEAQTAGLVVHDDGSISYPGFTSGDPGAEPQPAGTVDGTSSGSMGSSVFEDLARRKNPHASLARELAVRIARELRTASAVDGLYKQSITRLRAEPGLDVTRNTWADVAGDRTALKWAAGDVVIDDIPQNRTPNERRVWWENLTEEQRNQYIALYPQIVGNLDGIPAAARDEANRAYLPALILQLEASGDPSAETKIAGLERIQQKLNEGSVPPMFLLGIGAEGGGRAIVAFNNPDTSQNVGVYVPGTNTRLDTSFASGDLNRAKGIAIKAGQVNPDSTTSTIAWLGYDTPQVRTPSYGALDVGDRDNARTAAPAFNSFVEGLGATSTYAGPHLTAIGHSYGTLVIGEATRDRPGGIPYVDDIVLVGSPGVGLQDAEELKVGREHVFVGSSDKDPITDLPSREEAGTSSVLGFAGAVAGFIAGGPGMAQAGAELGVDLGRDIFDDDNDDVWFGKDPSSSAFGAERFPTGPIGHSDYFTVEDGDNQVSGDHIAEVVAGRSDLVPRIPHR